MTVLLGRSTGLSHPGRKRRRNEDAWVCQPPLFAVADGMGGARGGEDNITVVFFEMTDKAPEPPAETKAMPVMQPPDPPTEADEDTLSGLESVPAVQTMVVAPGEARASTDGAEPEEAKERFSVQAARLIVALAVVAALALLVYWLLGQSR